jgi:UDP-N-acetylglucosamine 2-epimerase (non-hydrolysing)
MRIAIIVGTRPEIIKMSPIIRECQRQKLDYFILHTGQHYSYDMDRVFFENLNLPDPHYNLDVGSGSHGEQTGKMLIGIEKVLLKEKPDIVLVQGDTNTVAAGTLAASKLGIKVGHVEAGLRSFDRNMPEEANRVLSDHLSDYLFAPTEESINNLLKEGIGKNKIHLAYNTITDAVYQSIDIARQKSTILEELGLKTNEYFLVTAHRQENVDDEDRLNGIFQGLNSIASSYSCKIVFPIHPRTLKRVNEFGINVPEKINIIDPVGFLDFLQLEANARLIITDSGGLQEESCILGVPCVTLRDNTERPETVEVGSNMLASTNPEMIEACAEIMLQKERNWDNPFGDGHSAKRIIETIRRELSDYLFVPIEDSITTLLQEGIDKNKMHLTYKTITKAFYPNVDIEGQTPSNESGIKIPDKIHIIGPAGFLDSLQLEANACLTITDSEGVHEESCILKAPCMTLRDNRESIEVDSKMPVAIGHKVIEKSAVKCSTKKETGKIHLVMDNLESDKLKY